MRELYEDYSLEEVFARYQQTRPEANVYGCVHSYTLDNLILATRNPQTLAKLRILNLVRHPVISSPLTMRWSATLRSTPLCISFTCSGYFPKLSGSFRNCS